MNEQTSSISPDTDRNIGLTRDIVVSYVSHNSISQKDLPELISQVHGAIMGLSGTTKDIAPVEALKPAVPIRKSVTDDYLVCLEDGLKFKSLKRHLRTHFNLSPDEYRIKWGLPVDYPMVAASYSATRSKLAKDNGLGRKAPEKPERARKVA